MGGEIGQATWGEKQKLWAGKIESRPYWVDTPVILNKGTRYYFRVGGHWLDAKNESDANGYDRTYLTPAKFALRCREPGATWFTLIGSVARTPSTQFVIADASRWRDGWVAPLDGPLSCFANDAPLFYWNNTGALDLEVWQ